MTILQPVILGLVQGLSEFLPISSSGHLILARAIMGIADQAEAPVYQMLDILLHAGTLIAVLVVFWKDWMGILRNPFKSKTLLLLFIASLPALFVELLFHDSLDNLFAGWFVGVAFLITAAFMYLAEKLSKQGGRHRKRTEEPEIKNAVVMGCMQAIALLPGVSRSGSTILGGIASRLTRQSAAKFAFMMSAPAILGSLVIKGKGALDNGYFQQLEMIPVIAGLVMAAISGYFAIRFMLKLITRISLGWFAFYAAILGVAVIILQLVAPGFLPIPGFSLGDTPPLA